MRILGPRDDVALAAGIGPRREMASKRQSAVGNTTYPRIRPFADVSVSRSAIGSAQKYIVAGLTGGAVKG